MRKAAYLAVPLLLCLPVTPALGGFLTTQYTGIPYQDPWGTQLSGQHAPGWASYELLHTPRLGETTTGTVTLTPPDVVGLPVSDGGGIVVDFTLAQLLAVRFPDWTFNWVGGLSENSLVVRTYEAYASQNLVQVDFNVEYHPNAGDPLNNMHWIQWIATNDLYPNPFGVHVDVLDIAPGQQDPYYDTAFTANDRILTDTPNRQGGAKDGRYLDFRTYLVQEVAPKTVNIYDGISWGWREELKVGPTEPWICDNPEPSTLVLAAIGSLALVGARLRKRLGALVHRKT